MSDIVGSIQPAQDYSIEEAPSWTVPVSCINIYDSDGIRRGRIMWDASHVDAAFNEKVSELCALAFRARSSSTSAAS